MPLTSSDDLESFIYQTYQERGVCARLTIDMASDSTEISNEASIKDSKKQQPRMTGKVKPMNIFSSQRNSSKRSSHKTEENDGGGSGVLDLDMPFAA